MKLKFGAAFGKQTRHLRRSQVAAAVVAMLCQGTAGAAGLPQMQASLPAPDPTPSSTESTTSSQLQTQTQTQQSITDPAAAAPANAATAAQAKDSQTPQNLDPKLIACIQNMASLYRQGLYKDAINVGRAILKSAPTNLETHYLLGNIYFKLNDQKTAAQQFDYCVKTGGDSPVAKMSSTALAGIKAGQTKGANQSGTATASGANDRSGKASKSSQGKPVSLTTLKNAERILERAQNDLQYKKKQLDAEILHTEEFARSRIREIPYNTVYRRMSAFAGIQAARDNEDLYTAPNYDRPIEVAKIRSTETARIQRLTEDYKSREKNIISSTLAEVALLLGDDWTESSVSQGANAGGQTEDSRKGKDSATTGDALTACGAVTHKEDFGHRVISVAAGSTASRAGLVPGDLIVQTTFIPGADLLRLTITRSGKNYALQLHPMKNVAAAAAQTATSQKSNAPVAPKLTSSQQAWARIKDSEIVFVIDMSANMRQVLGDTGLSRWDWASGRLLDFAESISKDKPMSFTLILCYQTTYELYRDQTPASLRQRLTYSQAIETSNVTMPLTHFANDYLESHNSKPLLMLTVTDGHPDRGDSLEVAVKSIVEKAKTAEQVRLVFFQIGDDPQGSSMLHMLDNDLTYTGMKHDIVDYVSFSELQESGLSRALLDAYERPRSVGKAVLPTISTTLAARLEDVRAKITEAR